MTHKINTQQRDRFFESRNWSATDFLKWYVKSVRVGTLGKVLSSRKMAADYLYGMEDDQILELTRLANDLLDDLARHRKRKTAMSQLSENETLSTW